MPQAPGSRLDRCEALFILGLDEAATPDQIRTAYRALCHQLHPDHFQDPSRRAETALAFLRVRDAYEYFKENGHQVRAEAGPAPEAGKPWEPDPEMEEWLRVLRARHRESRPFYGLQRWLLWCWLVAAVSAIVLAVVKSGSPVLDVWGWLSSISMCFLPLGMFTLWQDNSPEDMERMSRFLRRFGSPILLALLLGGLAALRDDHFTIFVGCCFAAFGFLTLMVTDWLSQF
ncbi:MAG: J domain-containing protein [Elusimicrobia bacterium]|nr:J domain-containing protein [Elusimicrobiota bacterium]